MKQKIENLNDWIAKVDKDIICIGKGKYAIIIPKPLVDSKVLHVGKKYSFEIKECAEDDS
jgi:hypothetical protein